MPAMARNEVVAVPAQNIGDPQGGRTTTVTRRYGGGASSANQISAA